MRDHYPDTQNFLTLRKETVGGDGPGIANSPDRIKISSRGRTGEVRVITWLESKGSVNHSHSIYKVRNLERLVT